MINKTILITGANAGLGREASRQLAAMGARIIMVCRNQEKAEQTRDEIIATTGNRNIGIQIADFASLEQVREMAGRVMKKYDRLDVLINNAGVFVTDLQITKSGHELQWEVNHLAPFLLTNLLMPLIEKSAPARIINVTSVAHRKGSIYFDDLNLEKNYNGLTAYRQSKLANVLFTLELAERTRMKNISVNCLHPGMVRTAFGHKYNNHWMGWGWMFMKPFMRPVESGAGGIIRLAADEDVAGITGQYFTPEGKVKTPNNMAYEVPLRKKLWKISENMTGLKNIV